MLCVVSPAKSMDFEHAAPVEDFTQPALLDHSRPLIERLRRYSPAELGALMRISDKLAALNVTRYAQWQTPLRIDDADHPAKQAVFAFTGDVYTGMAPASFTPTALTHAQQHLRILSGLYGVLRPLDLILPYRLEMGTRLPNSAGDTLYAYWSDIITDRLRDTMAASGMEVLINLASTEYFKAIDVARLGYRVITPVFKDEKKGQLKIISFNAKKARGAMAAWLSQEAVQAPESLKRFEGMGYRFSPAHSTDDTWTFIR